MGRTVTVHVEKFVNPEADTCWTIKTQCTYNFQMDDFFFCCNSRFLSFDALWMKKATV